MGRKRGETELGKYGRDSSDILKRCHVTQRVNASTGIGHAEEESDILENPQVDNRGTINSNIASLGDVRVEERVLVMESPLVRSVRAHDEPTRMGGRHVWRSNIFCRQGEEASEGSMIESHANVLSPLEIFLRARTGLDAPLSLLWMHRKQTFDHGARTRGQKRNLHSMIRASTPNCLENAG